MQSLKRHKCDFYLGTPCSCGKHYRFAGLKKLTNMFEMLNEMAEFYDENPQEDLLLRTFPPIAVMTYGETKPDFVIVCLSNVDHNTKPVMFKILREGDLHSPIKYAGEKDCSNLIIDKSAKIFKCDNMEFLLQKCHLFADQHFTAADFMEKSSGSRSCSNIH